jgi:7,8-dihydropterin-6-yl-methyl-4-(beta-D-ribofuranosyl)aminobenzene 5'-phosphate synthase
LKEVSVTTQIANGAYTTGELGKDIKEQSLVLQSKRGNLVVMGCSHPGLGLIIEKAMELGEVYGIIGGFHGFDEYYVMEGVKLVVPCHCTRHKKEIKELYPESCEIGFAGKIIEI